MTQDELFLKIQAVFPQIEKASVTVKDYLTIRLTSREQIVPLASWLKTNGFDYLDMLTATDYLGPVDMKGYIRQANFNPFLPEGATPEIESAPTAGYAYRASIDHLWSFVSMKDRCRVIVKFEQPRDAAHVPTLSHLFKTADWQERETFDLLGIHYDGHPNETKILTPDFLKGHPLRKDYVHIKDRFDE
jgi:NADH:ubiquinone oxidoreductase subunit C